MRMKRRNDKGEIFRKSLCCITHSDSEESEAESNDKDNQKTQEQQKSEGKPDKSFGKREKVSNKRPQTTCAHRSKRTSHRNHSSSKNKRHERGKEHVNRKRPENVSTAAIISTNRITRNLGIYNKAKRSDTISRENSKQKLCKKKFEDIRMKTERDIARVLDCSSFKIQHPSYSFLSGPDSPVYSNNSARMDYPTASSAISHRSQSSCSSSGRYSNPEKNKITPLQRSTPQKPRSYNEAGLAFKTPLQEISQSLTEALWPAETFHRRDYLAEVQGQLRKMYKQSSVSSHVQRMESNAGIASEFQKRCLKRKSVEENNTGSMKTATNEEKVQTVVEGLSDHLAGCKRQSTSNTYQIISSENSKQQDRFLQTIPFRDSSRGTLQSSEYFDLQAKCPSTVTRHDKGKEMDFPSCREVQRCLFGQSEASLATTSGQAQMFSHNSTSPDILDFLDGVEHTQEHRRCITPDPRLVSPPKKPTLDSLTPEKKFYPHKLY